MQMDHSGPHLIETGIFAHQAELRVLTMVSKAQVSGRILMQRNCQKRALFGPEEFREGIC
jgi:hypothetical protein